MNLPQNSGLIFARDPAAPDTAVTKQQGLPRDGTILFISHEASRTGAPIVLLNVMRWLQSHISNRFRIILRTGGPLEQQFRKLGEVHVIAHAGFNESYLRNVCLIYSNTVTNGPFLRSLPYGEIPIITHVHELDHSIDRLGAYNFREVRTHSSHFIACSHIVAEALTQIYGVDGDVVSVIPESISPSEVQSGSQLEDPGVLRKTLGIGEDEFVVVGCGTAGYRKGVDLFVQLAAYCSQHVSRISFIWIGSLPDDVSGGFFQHDACKLGISHKIKFIGQMENPHPVIAAADLFCLPSREDPLPLVMLEAGALGKPVLAFEQSGGAEEYCGQGAGFLVPYLNVRAMGDLILKHMDDKATLFKIGEQARRLVQEKYNIDSTGPMFAGLIRRFSRNVAAGAAGVSQLFIPTLRGHSQESSVCQQVIPHRWNRMKFTFRSQAFGSDWIIRLDPLDRTSVIEIARLLVKSTVDGCMLWKAYKAEDFDAVRVAGTAVRLPDPRMLRLLSLGPDPIIHLPPLDVRSEEQEYQVEVLLRADTSIDSVAQSCPPLIDAYRKQDELCRKRDDLRLQAQQLRSQLALSMDSIEALRLALFHAQTLPRGRETLIWGTGAAGKYLAEVLVRHGYAFRGFIDRDPEKAGQEMMGHPIFGPAALARNAKKRPFIIIGSQFHQQIGRRLKRMGYVRGVDFAGSPFV
jgi:glycosyltransferase involved in cell wall biosynthesis